jgi:chaperonin cofactor prefoldin
MAKKDAEQFETDSLADLRKELEGKIKDLKDELNPKIENKVPIWALSIVITILLAIFGLASTSLFNQVSSLSTRVNEFDKSNAIMAEKIESLKENFKASK